MGRIRRVIGPFHYTGIFWYRFCLVAARYTPGLLLRPLLFALASACFLLLANVRRALGRNLAVVAGPLSGWRAGLRTWRTFHEQAWCQLERYELFLPGRAVEVVGDERELWEEICASPRGAVLATAHIGVWEAASRVPVTSWQRTIHLVRDEELDPASQRFLRELLSGLGSEEYVTHFAADDPSLGVRLLAGLREGAFVALQGDRPRGGGKWRAVELFGRRMPLPLGPAALARAADVPLVPIFAYREGRGRYRLVLRAPIHVARTEDRDADVADALDRFGRDLAEAIVREPSQWHCFADAFLPDSRSAPAP